MRKLMVTVAAGIALSAGSAYAQGGSSTGGSSESFGRKTTLQEPSYVTEDRQSGLDQNGNRGPYAVEPVRPATNPGGSSASDYRVASVRPHHQDQADEAGG
ncbi:MAG TPA: hypothetical protein VLV17_00170 [Anaeromyxobacteraceae bacterium]|nr:hypothetical protein [Anaeromyxobacteraceae bacterium]